MIKIQLFLKNISHFNYVTRINFQLSQDDNYYLLKLINIYNITHLYQKKITNNVLYKESIYEFSALGVWIWNILGYKITQILEKNNSCDLSLSKINETQFGEKEFVNILESSGIIANLR